MSNLIGIINNYIQRRMQVENLQKVPLTVAARWLDEADILKDSSSSPGYSLRRHVYRGNIFGVYKENNYFWFIKKIDEYVEIFTVADLAALFGLKNRTSIYRKIHQQKIPFYRMKNNGIYFRVSDLLKWAMEENQPEMFEKIKQKLSTDHLNKYFEQIREKLNNT